MSTITRRSFIKTSAGAATALSVGGLLAACGDSGSSGGGNNNRVIKIGYVSPQTGALAGFGEADAFIQKGLSDAIEKKLNGRKVQIIIKDSQSDQNRAGSAAADLILKDKVDLMLVGNTPETTNPVSDQCEANGVPCISSLAPWQPWYFRNPKVTEKGYQWTYHFFWGLEDVIEVFTNLWASQNTNKVVGALWPNDGDGVAWSDPKTGFPPALEAKGYKVIDPGRYKDLNDDFTAQITAFKNANVEIVTGVVIPPDLTTFMSQAAQQGFKPKMVTVAKAALFPSAVGAIANNLGEGITSEIWWSPSHPFKSSLTGASATDFATAYKKDTNKQWTQPIGYVHALFEVAADVLSRTPNVDDKNALRDAIKATNINTLVGPVAWGKGPTPNVAKTSLVGGQWKKGTDFPFDLVITTNTLAPNIPTAGKTDLMPWSK
jgi:branched-chain amino acid transport system substrate-binding protein